MREVKSAGNLVADVEGDIEDVDGVLKITKIRLRYRFKIPARQPQQGGPGTRILRREMPGLPECERLYRLHLGGGHPGRVKITRLGSI